MSENLHVNLNLIAALIGLLATIITILWSLAETKRKLENQFQKTEEELKLAKKELENKRIALDIHIKDYYSKTERIVNDLGSQVDKNTGAIATICALKKNNIILSKLTHG